MEQEGEKGTELLSTEKEGTQGDANQLHDTIRICVVLWMCLYKRIRRCIDTLNADRTDVSSLLPKRCTVSRIGQATSLLSFARSRTRIHGCLRWQISLLACYYLVNVSVRWAWIVDNRCWLNGYCLAIKKLISNAFPYRGTPEHPPAMESIGVSRLCPMPSAIVEQTAGKAVKKSKLRITVRAAGNSNRHTCTSNLPFSKLPLSVAETR